MRRNWMYYVKLVGVAVTALLLAGCVFVQPTVAGKKVRVLTAGEVERCRALGNLTSTVADRVGAIVRNQDAVQEDVTLNAQNAAADMGADTIVPVEPMQNGKQIFAAYRCLP
jgi:hypothetical protein